MKVSVYLCVHIYVCMCVCVYFNMSVGKFGIFVGMIEASILDRGQLRLCTKLKTNLEHVWIIMCSGVLQNILFYHVCMYVCTCAMLFTTLLDVYTVYDIV